MYWGVSEVDHSDPNRRRVSTSCHVSEVTQPSPPKRQHVVSQVLLRRFADERGELAVFDRVPFKEGRKGPRGVAYVENYIVADPVGAEQMWTGVEQALPAALAVLDAGPPFDDQDSVAAVKECIALHWARSLTMQAIYDRSLPAQREKVKWNVLAEVNWKDAFLEIFGLHPAGTEAERIVRDHIEKHFDGHFADGAFFFERVQAIMQQARDLLADYNLEVGEAVEGEFLISDNPVLTKATGVAGAGPLGGVPWHLADVLMMPLGPKHVVSVIKRDHEWMRCDKASVEAINAIQVEGAFRQIAYRPGANLEAFVAARATQLDPRQMLTR